MTTETRITVFDTENVTVWVYPEKGILHHQFHQYCYGDTFREILMTALEAFKTNGCSKWLSDDKYFGALLPKDKKWGDEVWRPQMLASGWKYWAMVLPEKVTGKMNIKKMVQEYELLGVTTSFHQEPETAYEWLASQN